MGFYLKYNLNEAPVSVLKILQVILKNNVNSNMSRDACVAPMWR